MSLQIPDYIIDERLITAIRRNVTSYLSSYFKRNPKYLSSYYFHLSTKTDTGMFENLFYTPAKYILTPIAYAVLYNCEKSLTFLLSAGADPNTPGVVADCPVEDAKLRWKIDLFRLHEVCPVCLTTPSSNIFTKLVQYGLKLSIDYKLRFRIVTMEETKERIEISRGVWELAWIFWIKMRDSEIMLQTTDALIAKGMDATFIMERVNLLPLSKKIFKIQNLPNKNESIYIIDLMKILLWSGCDFDKTKLVEYIYPCIRIFFKDPSIMYSSVQEIVNRYKVLQGIANLSNKFKKILIEKGVFDLKIISLNKDKFFTLQVLTISVIRKYLTAVLFNKKLSELTLDSEIKESIQSVIPVSQNDQFLKQMSTLKIEEGPVKVKSFQLSEDSADHSEDTVFSQFGTKSVTDP